MEIPAAELAVSLPRAILIMTTSLVSGIIICGSEYNMLQINEMSMISANFQIFTDSGLWIRTIIVQ